MSENSQSARTSGNLPFQLVPRLTVSPVINTSFASMATPNFTGLPREIRDAILGLCLVVQGPINPNPAHYEDPDPFKDAERKPDIALLSVNKMVSAEATEIFFGQNVWRFGANIRYPYRAWYTDLLACVSYFKASYVHHVLMSFDVRDINVDELLDITMSAHEDLPDAEQTIERTEQIHLYRVRYLERHCNSKMHFFKRYPTRNLMVDLRNLYCPSGCCRDRILDDIIGEILSGWDDRRNVLSVPLLQGRERAPRTKLVIKGLATLEERNKLRWAWYRPLETAETETESDMEIINWLCPEPDDHWESG